MCSPNYTEARPLLVILHDPPEVLASPDPRTGKIELHNSWLVSRLHSCTANAVRPLTSIKTDIIKTYVDWAVKQGFAVIDVNLPKHLSDSDDAQEHVESRSIEFRSAEATQLLTYLWDNYIELNESSHVFLLGTNIGHSAIINFIKQDEDRAQQAVTAAISFVEDVPLQSCRSATNDSLALWYYNFSLVFVEQEHNFWYSELSRKPKKRFGRVNRSSERTVTEMLIEHKDAVFELLLHDTMDFRSRRIQNMAGIPTHASVPQPANTTRTLPPVSNFALSPVPKPVTKQVSTLR